MHTSPSPVGRLELHTGSWRGHAPSTRTSAPGAARGRRPLLPGERPPRAARGPGRLVQRRRGAEGGEIAFWQPKDAERPPRDSRTSGASTPSDTASLGARLGLPPTRGGSVGSLCKRRLRRRDARTRTTNGTRPATLVGARPALRRFLHGDPRRGDRGRRAPLDPGGAQLLGTGAAVGCECLRPHLRRTAPARRTRGRPPRPPARLHGRGSSSSPWPRFSAGSPGRTRR